MDNIKEGLKIENLSAYEVVKKEELKEVNGIGYILSHKKTKARVLVVKNDDRNKVFTIGFKTPPSDSTGTPHIIEHTVLCGSKKYPVKDPFVELCKGSMNTFLNAMTYSDKTVYPVASCNDKDFHNLMDVYLDAVFYPNIYAKEEIFKQEGWHYELDDLANPITINGVVYNEMKGVYSSADSVVYRSIEEKLLPDTTYRHDSGGHPDVIPSLTREAYLDFHRKYYHPSNSYIYIYGDMDIAKELEYIDNEYLKDFTYLDVDASIAEQKAFDTPISYSEKYSLSEAESLEDNTYLVYGVSIGKSTDKKLTTALDILEYALLNAPGAPLKKAIIDAGFCSDVETSYDTSLMQPYFAIVARNANASDKDKFIELINAFFADAVKNKLNKRALTAAINHFEFKHKEANFGRYPKGLMLGLDAFETWLYDDNAALDLFTLNDVIDELKSDIDTDYFESIIENYIINNNHKVYGVIEPCYGLNDENEKQLLAKLDEYKASLSEEELKQLIADTEHLKQYQSEPSPKEDLEKIPLLEISDLDKNAMKLENDIQKVGDTTVVAHDIFTNGISYIELSFDIADIEFELIKTASFLCEVFKYVDTDNYSYNDLASEIDIELGSLGFSVVTGDRIRDVEGLKTPSKNVYLYFSAKMKMLDEKVKVGFDLLGEILTKSHITDKKRLKEIIAEIKSDIKEALASSGHMTTMARSLSYFSEASAIREELTGIEYYRYIDMLDTDFDNQYEKLCSDMNKVMRYFLRKEGLMVSYTSDKKIEEYLGEPLAAFAEKLSDEPLTEKKYEFTPNKKNEGFKTSSKVQYVATAGTFTDAGLEYNAALSVLQVIFSYDYLWINVRVQGGAYGCMCGFVKSGASYFVSYRDPKLMETYDVYKKAHEYVANFDCDDRDMVKYIIGTMNKIDAPLSPAGLGTLSYIYYVSGVTEADLQREKDQILSTNQEKIRSLAGHIKAITDNNIICAIGDEKKIEEAKDNFKEVKNLV